MRGAHAFLGASKYHWTNYTVEKLEKAYVNFRAAQIGTELHDMAERLISMGIKLPNVNSALNMFVNDAIMLGMTPELVLYYSDNAFGTADAVLFKDGKLTIHDLKTGVTKASFRQLEVYTALFCLEYGYEPHDLQIMLRIYQGEEVFEHVPDPGDIEDIMTKLIEYDKLIEKFNKEME